MIPAIRKGLVFVTLPVVLIWAAVNYPGNKKAPVPETPAPAINQQVPTLQVPPVSEANVNLEKLEEKTAELWGSDPFRIERKTKGKPGIKRLAKNPEWKLAGIVYSASTPQAIINNRPVGIGDVVNDARVVDIEKSAVTLELNGRRFKLVINRG